MSVWPTRQGAVMSVTSLDFRGNSTRRRGRAGNGAANGAPCGRRATRRRRRAGRRHRPAAARRRRRGSSCRPLAKVAASVVCRQEEAPPARLRRWRRRRGDPFQRSDDLRSRRHVGRRHVAGRRQDDDLGARRGAPAGPAGGRGQPPHWLAQMMRAIHSMSRTLNVRPGWAGLSEASSTRACGLLQQDLGHHLAVGGLDDDAIALPAGGIARHDQPVAVAIERHHGIAGDLQGKDVVAGAGGKIDLVPAAAGGKAGIVEEAAGAGLGEAEKRHCRTLGSSWRAGGRNGAAPGSRRYRCPSPRGSWRCFRSTASAGARRRRSRLDLLNVVGSSPARRARPEALRRLRSASRSIADQMRAWDNTAEPPPCRRGPDRNSGQE